MLHQHSSNTIKITEDDANSEHVEGLLRRQMSLRGERGITAVKKRRWWMQNWFILMVVGAVAAWGAWAILEPFFDDVAYYQGTIASVSKAPALLSLVKPDGKQAVYQQIGMLRIGDEQVKLYDRTETYRNGVTGEFDLSELKVGQEVGVYVHNIGADDEDSYLAVYVDPAPKPQSTWRASRTIQQLEAQGMAAGLMLFPMVAGFVGLSIGAVDGIICRLPRRAILSGLVGLLIGVLGGFISILLGGMVYSALSGLAEKQGLFDQGKISPFAFFIQMTGRGLGWMIAGTAMGLGQAIALRSKRLLLYGLIGGVVGGLLGGLLFDPITILISGRDNPSAHLSRMISLTVIGLSVGAMIGVVELLARDAWLRMTEGPLTGKEFLLFKDVMRIGSSSRSDLYLFNDPQVAETHASIRTSGDHSEIESDGPEKTVLVNGRPTRHSRLRHGDQITIGRTSFLFQSKKG